MTGGISGTLCLFFPLGLLQHPCHACRRLSWSATVASLWRSRTKAAVTCLSSFGCSQPTLEAAGTLFKMFSNF